MKNKGQIISLIGIFALLVISPVLSYATLENGRRERVAWEDVQGFEYV